MIGKIIEHIIMLFLGTIGGTFVFIFAISLGTYQTGWKLWIMLPVMIGSLYGLLLTENKQSSPKDKRLV